ncbi:helix-turn-helix transcriptional regulator [Bacillus pseudomycoides]|uniref:Helix-turn-helix transcriptional regulator n=1 Tax=Bacillus bingmayongensis TaxID=1150157 RepID=A0ABU5JYZ6_9BACI|nr:helix-turn-helix transcriptional regulator [Bacillus pseudomycoides]
MDIGARLKFLRNRYGWTMQEVADRIGKNDSTYSGYETNKRKPNAEVLCQLADTFNTTTDFILGRTEDPNSMDLNVKELLKNGKLNWDGRELDEDEAEKVTALLEVAIQRMLK